MVKIANPIQLNLDWIERNIKGLIEYLSDVSYPVEYDARYTTASETDTLMGDDDITYPIFIIQDKRDDCHALVLIDIKYSDVVEKDAEGWEGPVEEPTKGEYKGLKFMYYSSSC